MADPSKTEKATPRRRNELRGKGQVAKSQELNSAVIFILALVFLRFYFGSIRHFVSTFTQNLWRKLPKDLDVQSVMEILTQMGSGLLLALGLIAFLYACVGHAGASGYIASLALFVAVSSFALHDCSSSCALSCSAAAAATTSRTRPGGLCQGPRRPGLRARPVSHNQR